jgi:hypothetical protein
VGIKEAKRLISQLNRRRPPEPKNDLLTVLKREGADFKSAAQVDAELYRDAGIEDKDTGIKDELSKWLEDKGFMEPAPADMTYEQLSEREEKAAELINKALSGEKVYRPEDAGRLAEIENYDANIEAIREIFGRNIRGAEETLRAITELENKGYRVVGNTDIEYVEGEAAQLGTFAETERRLRKRVEELTEDNEVLRNTAEKRLLEIGKKQAENFPKPIS